MTERKISYGISYLVLTTNIPNSEANVLVLKVSTLNPAVSRIASLVIYTQM